MAATLFDLSAEAASLTRRIDDAAACLCSDDPLEAAAAVEQLEALLAEEAGNRQALEHKADAWCWVISSIVAAGEARLAHAKRLDALAEADLRRAEQMKQRLIDALLRLDPEATTFNLPTHKITSRKSQVVELDPELDALDLPDEFQRSRTTVSVDKTALKDALKAGRVVAGAHLISRRSWKLS